MRACRPWLDRHHLALHVTLQHQAMPGLVKQSSNSYQPTVHTTLYAPTVFCILAVQISVHEVSIRGESMLDSMSDLVRPESLCGLDVWNLDGGDEMG